MIEPSIIIAAFSAAMQTIQTWFAARDARKASKKANSAYKRTHEAKLAVTEGNRLSRIVPDDVLQAMEQRVMNCWQRYRDVMDPNQGRMPGEIDEATEALKRCLCEELRRINDLNGSIPSGKLRKWWETYCGEELKDSR